MMIGVLLTAVFLLIAAASEQGGKKKSKKVMKPKIHTVSYKTDVVPVIKKYCLPCHTEDQMNPSELYLDSYEGLIHGGKHGSPVVASKADSSLMIRKLGSPPPFGDQMPLKAKILPTEPEIKILRDWINQGAKNN